MEVPVLNIRSFIREMQPGWPPGREIQPCLRVSAHGATGRLARDAAAGQVRVLGLTTPRSGLEPRTPGDGDRDGGRAVK